MDEKVAFIRFVNLRQFFMWGNHFSEHMSSHIKFGQSNIGNHNVGKQYLNGPMTKHTNAINTFSANNQNYNIQVEHMNF